MFISIPVLILIIILVANPDAALGLLLLAGVGFLLYWGAIIGFYALLILLNMMGVIN